MAKARKPAKPAVAAAPPSLLDDAAAATVRADDAASRAAEAARKAARRGRAAQRLAFLAQRAGAIDADELRAAIRARNAPHAAGARAAPDPAQQFLWLPIGPTAVLQGQAGGRPRVAGRVRDLQVSADGLRAYAATANGGVWYSDDAGESWRPLGGWTITGTPPAIDRPSGVLACGCLLVRFDPGNDPTLDEVLVGTGELIPIVRGRPFSRTSGVGVLRAVGPSASAMFASPWNLEATNLSGKGLFRLARDPAALTTLVVATSGGLWSRSGAPVANWTQVAVAPFNGASGLALICTDVCWVQGSGATPTRLWVAVRDDVGASSGLFVSTAGLAGPFAPVALPGLQPSSRISLANAPSDPKVLYALGNGNLVWRLDDLAAVAVERVPPNLLGGQDTYNQAIGVHPTRPERIVLGGATERADGEWSASLYLASVTAPAAGRWRFGFAAVAAGANPTTDDAYIGHGVHADIHAARFVTVGARNELWIGCDGGVFRSLRGNDDNRVVKHSFIARNNGLTTLECGYVATHPGVDGHVIAGAQDNGTLERLGMNVWGRPFRDGDGGSVAYHPVTPHRYLGQVTNAAWRAAQRAADPAFNAPVRRTNPLTANETTEDGNAAFYTGVDAVRVPGATAAADTARLAWGSTRVWFSGDWGSTWRTLPSLGDPMAVLAQSLAVDPCVLTSTGAPDTSRGQVIACRWASPTRLYVLCQREVLKYDIVADTTTPSGLRVTPTRLTVQSPVKKEDPQAAATVTTPGQRLPEVGAWSDIASHDPARGPHGSLYVAGTGDPATAAMDTVWWFDGTNRWHATGLRTDPDATKRVPAPAYAVAVDPRDRNIVYVGTAVGVWRGVFDPGATHWGWTPMNNGLPEAAVQDLTVHDQGGTGPHLLRAAIQARGIWEADLATPNLGARTLLRVHAYDTRRQSPTPLVDPKAPPPAVLSWHASPDLRARPRRGSRPPAPVGLPWSGAASNQYGLWVLQTALHARGGGDPLVKPDGVWTPLFERRLVDAVNALPGSHAQPNRVTLARWNAIVGSGAAFPDAYADPWNGASPTEADLIELVVDRGAPVGSTASMGLGRVHARVDVQVHHRHTTPVPANQVRVTLLMRDVSGTADPAWATLAAAWTVPVQTLLRNGGALPTLADNWAFADATQAVRSPTADVDARVSRVVAFEVDFSALPAAVSTVLLVAVVHSDVDQVTLAAGNLQSVVLNDRWVALRSIALL